jgi:hypothetical protein
MTNFSPVLPISETANFRYRGEEFHNSIMAAINAILPVLHLKNGKSGRDHITFLPNKLLTSGTDLRYKQVILGHKKQSNYKGVHPCAYEKYYTNSKPI